MRTEAHLSHDRIQVVLELILRCADIALTTSLVSGSTRTTEDLSVSLGHASLCLKTHLQDIEHGQVHERPSTTVVHLCALDNDCMRRQVDTPSKCRGTAQYL